MLKNKMLSAMGGAPANYIEDVFSTWLYTGNGSTQTITNGIDLAGEGGLVWQKMRSDVASHLLTDTVRGSGYALNSNSTGAQFYNASIVSSFNSNGFTDGGSQASGATYASWTFRKAPKFFDVVTWVGDGAATKTINHNLGSEPGCIITKSSSGVNDWWTYHRGASATPLRSYVRLNATDAVATSGSNLWGATSTTITVPSALTLNDSGATYVAYLFAHNAGGFGLSGTDNVISCGSYTGNGSATGPVVDLGYEPQWLLVKQSSSTGNWFLADTMRGFDQTSDQFLLPNSSGAEFTRTNYVKPLATGFQIVNADFDVNESGGTYIYIAIRRGPMAVPTSGTSVFAPVTYTGDGSTTRDLSFGFPVDMFMVNFRNTAAAKYLRDRLRGGTVLLNTTGTAAESAAYTVGFDSNTGLNDIPSDWDNASGITCVDWAFGRAPGFMDEVCYRGAGSTQDLKHNLGVPPELLIFKDRSNSSNWDTYYPVPGQSYFYDMKLNTLATPTNRDYSNSVSRMRAAPDATTIYLNTSNFPNNASNLVCYLFATCPGVSKVGIVEATGSLQTVNCGFTSGARFVMIKSITDSSNSAYGWRVYDSARGITSGNDPVLYLNSTDAETNTQNSIGVVSSGFQITGSDPYLSSGSFIFLAIA